MSVSQANPNFALDSGTSADLRSVLIQLEDARLLLPNAAVAEVLSFAAPEQVEGAPAWLAGRIRWRGWRVPLVDFSRWSQLGDADSSTKRGNRVVVLKTVGGNASLPFVALLTHGYPRLVTVASTDLADIDDTDATLPKGVLAQVKLKEDAVLIPDMDALEAQVDESLTLQPGN